MQDFDNNCHHTDEEVTRMLRDAAEAYHFAVCAAEKFNTLTVAHKHHLTRAVDRASDMGKLVDAIAKAVKDEF